MAWVWESLSKRYSYSIYYRCKPLLRNYQHRILCLSVFNGYQVFGLPYRRRDEMFYPLLILTRILLKDSAPALRATSSDSGTSCTNRDEIFNWGVSAEPPRRLLTSCIATQQFCASIYTGSVWKNQRVLQSYFLFISGLIFLGEVERYSNQATS